MQIKCTAVSVILGLIFNFTQFKSFFFSKRQILDFSKLKQFVDNNFKFDENGRKFSKRVENTVGKGEIARYVGNSVCLAAYHWQMDFSAYITTSHMAWHG